MKISTPQTKAMGTLDGTRADTPQKKKLKEACQEFEAIFVTQMLKEMRPKGEDPILGSSHARDMYQEMMDEERARELTKTGSPLGIGETLYRQLLERMEAEEKPLPKPSEPKDTPV